MRFSSAQYLGLRNLSHTLSPPPQRSEVSRRLCGIHLMNMQEILTISNIRCYFTYIGVINLKCKFTRYVTCRKQIIARKHAHHPTSPHLTSPPPPPPPTPTNPQQHTHPTKHTDTHSQTQKLTNTNPTTQPPKQTHKHTNTYPLTQTPTHQHTPPPPTHTHTHTNTHI